MHYENRDRAPFKQGRSISKLRHENNVRLRHLGINYPNFISSVNFIVLEVLRLQSTLPLVRNKEGIERY